MAVEAQLRHKRRESPLQHQKNIRLVLVSYLSHRRETIHSIHWPYRGLKTLTFISPQRSKSAKKCGVMTLLTKVGQLCRIGGVSATHQALESYTMLMIRATQLSSLYKKSKSTIVSKHDLDIYQGYYCFVGPIRFLWRCNPVFGRMTSYCFRLWPCLTYSDLTLHLVSIQNSDCTTALYGLQDICTFDFLSRLQRLLCNSA